MIDNMLYLLYTYWRLLQKDISVVFSRNILYQAYNNYTNYVKCMIFFGLGTGLDIY